MIRLGSGEGSRSRGTSRRSTGTPRAAALPIGRTVLWFTGVQGVWAGARAMEALPIGRLEYFAQRHFPSVKWTISFTSASPNRTLVCRRSVVWAGLLRSRGWKHCTTERAGSRGGDARQGRYGEGVLGSDWGWRRLVLRATMAKLPAAHLQPLAAEMSLAEFGGLLRTAVETMREKNTRNVAEASQTNFTAALWQGRRARRALVPLPCSHSLAERLAES